MKRFIKFTPGKIREIKDDTTGKSIKYRLKIQKILIYYKST